LPPKADIGTELRNVRFVPIGDIASRRVASLVVLIFHCGIELEAP
jgi:hypothetical protein